MTDIWDGHKKLYNPESKSVIVYVDILRLFDNFEDKHKKDMATLYFLCSLLELADEDAGDKMLQVTDFLTKAVKDSDLLAYSLDMLSRLESLLAEKEVSYIKLKECFLKLI